VNILIAPDSFKGSLTSLRAAEIIAAGILRVHPAARCYLHPLADGGDGTLAILHRALGGELHTNAVPDPLGRMIDGPWLQLPDGSAVIESASCIGWKLLTDDERRPKQLSSAGLGLLLRHVLEAGVKHVYVGLGGSATNDCGLGLLEGLGARLEFESRKVPGESAPKSMLEKMQSLKRVEMDVDAFAGIVSVLADVRNPLIGPQGATTVYGPQKGVASDMIPAFDDAVTHVADILRRDVRDVSPDTPGMGAAGGLAFALASVCNADIREGAAFVREATGFEDALASADVVITGEGRIDAQTRDGKTVSGVIAAAREQGIPVIGIAGSVDAGWEQTGLANIIVISPEDMLPTEAMANAEGLLAKAVAEAWPRISSAL